MFYCNYSGIFNHRTEVRVSLTGGGGHKAVLGIVTNSYLHPTVLTFRRKYSFPKKNKVHKEKRFECSNNLQIQ